MYSPGQISNPPTDHKKDFLVTHPNDKLSIDVSVYYTNDAGNPVPIASTAITVYDCSATSKDDRCASCLSHSEWYCFWNLKEQQCVDENPTDMAAIALADKCPTILPWTNAKGMEQRIESGKSTKVNVKIKNQGQLNSICENCEVKFKCHFFQVCVNIVCHR